MTTLVIILTMCCYCTLYDTYHSYRRLPAERRDFVVAAAVEGRGAALRHGPGVFIVMIVSVIITLIVIIRAIMVISYEYVYY